MSAHHTSASSVGQRANNEDAYFATPGLYAVADGMGGHAAGEVASRIATEQFREWSGSIARFSADGMAEQVIRTCFNACNNRLLDYMRDRPETSGMGTTLTAFAINGAVATIGHVGDSRCYLVRAGRCEQITRDPNTYPLPKIITEKFTSIFDWQYTDSKILDYQSFPGIKFNIAI